MTDTDLRAAVLAEVAACRKLSEVTPKRPCVVCLRYEALALAATPAPVGLDAIAVCKAAWDVLQPGRASGYPNDATLREYGERILARLATASGEREDVK